MPGEETEALELVDISGIVEDMLELLKVSVSKHVRVETNLGKQLPAVRANPSQIRQIVMNLFYNASEAIGDRDGVIRVTTRQVTIGPDSSLATSERVAEGVYVQLEVSDTGRGMTPEMQARIFEPFFSTKQGAATAWGSPTVQGIVQASPRDHPPFKRAWQGYYVSDIPALWGTDGRGNPERDCASRVEGLAYRGGNDFNRRG